MQSARVIDGAGAVDADREREAVDRRVVAHRSQRVHGVRWDVYEVALADLAIFARDGHDPPARGDVIELVGRMVMRVDESATGNLELAHELEMPAFGDVEHLARAHQPPHGDRAVV